VTWPRPQTRRDEVARAFDGQAAAYERAPIQTDPHLLAALVRFADLAPGARVLDAGCGPGLVSEAFLADPRGYRVLGCDLSGEMVARARDRCSRFGDRAELVQAEVEQMAAELSAGRRAPIDAVVSRLVLHHLTDPAGFVHAMVGALPPRGVLVIADHVADPDPDLAEWHRRMEVMRDRTHVRNLTGGEIVDLMAAAGLGELRLEEHTVATDFEEWFARGTPSAGLEQCRALVLDKSGAGSRAWRATRSPDGNVRIDGVMAFVAGLNGGGSDAKTCQNRRPI
jgi:SAM-dependent methyltransferase